MHVSPLKLFTHIFFPNIIFFFMGLLHLTPISENKTIKKLQENLPHPLIIQ